MNYYKEIKDQLVNNEIYKKVKDYSKNRSDLDIYYNVGRLLAEAGKHYGEGIIKKYSEKLKKDVGKKYSVTNLKYMRSFYLNIGKGQTLSDFLSFSHYVELLSIKDVNEVNYYIDLSIRNNLSVRQLRERIRNKEYQRLDETAKKKLVNNKDINIEDNIKNPILIKSKELKGYITENLLHKLILENVESFMNELGGFYSFVGSEYKIKIGNTYNYIDLLLFNIKYNCYVVVELKVTELKKEHLGQIDLYMNYIDKNIKDITHNKTIGIIIVKEKNKFVIRYCSNKNIFSTEYKLINI